jgi:hypothetical protein
LNELAFQIMYGPALDDKSKESENISPTPCWKSEQNQFGADPDLYRTALVFSKEGNPLLVLIG